MPGSGFRDMGIKARYTQSDIDNMFLVRLRRIDSAVIARLQQIGETFVNNARANGDYGDVTGNLRSSIGYVIVKNGKKIFGSDFGVVKNGRDGQMKGKAHIATLISQFQKGYVLIAVAGMDYAAAVESKGKDVLTASSNIAKKQLRVAIREFKKQV